MSNEVLNKKLQNLLDGHFNDGQTLNDCLSLIKAGANPDTRGALTNNTALFECFDTVNVGFIRPLLELGSDVNQQDRIGRTLLHQALWCRDLTMVEVVLEFSPDVSLKDNHGRTVFDVASTILDPATRLPIVKLLSDYVLKNELASSQERSSSIESSFGMRN